MLDFLFDVVAGVLAWFYSLWPSFGMSIVFLTLAALLVITPLTLKGTKSMLQMQQHQPEIKKIQTQHRGDPQARNEAMMAFYKEKGLNPMGSCVPLLAQAPIFIVLYQVVRGLTRRTTEIGTQLGFTAGRDSVEASPGATTVQRSEQTFDPDFLSVDTQLYQRLNGETEMVSWGIDLSRSASEAMAEGIFQALPYLFMMLIVLVTGLKQHRQIQKRQVGTAGQPPQMQMIMKFLPWFLPIISYTFQAALVVYFIVSNLYRIGQQAYITRTLYSKEDSIGAIVTRQRSADQSEPDDDTTPDKSRTQPKGTATPKRDGDRGPNRGPSRSPKTPRPARTRTSRTSGPSSKSGGSGGGRTGKAPTRSRGGGGRVTPSGTSQDRMSPNRSKKKRKRR